MASPISVYRALNLPLGVVPPLRTPRTRIELSPGNFYSPITLRENQSRGARVIINNNAAQAATVNFSGLAFSVLPGEIVSFMVGENGLWQKETLTVDLLMVYSDVARNSLGQAAIEARNIEALGLINDALENSGANFRVRLVGLKELVQPADWTSLNIILPQLRTNPDIMAWRDAARADAVHYMTLGTPPECGLAYFNTVPSAFNMVASVVITNTCGTSATRHEFGHNMGIHHGDEQPTPIWARGDAITRTIVAGNAIPFYSTPHRFTPDLGIPMGAVDSVDAVRMMNINSPIVAAFR
ncbi:M12 family metallo-peptidase [Acerihabitans sp. KWT182]|uniref:M12 family metallo-peptidase n=1 Tax=Acerihabitans sp. KWT182 TaxID=3157919 RepID=A0AAU7QCF4_9GAMM